MKRLMVFGLIVVALMIVLLGCGGHQVKRPANSLDEWLEEVAFDKIVNDLKSNSFLKGIPFIIVKADGENVSRDIDNLTKDIRDRLLSVLLQHPEIHPVPRHPVSGGFFDRPYGLQSLRCGGFSEPQMLLTIDIKRLGQENSKVARVNIRAIDIQRGQWKPLSLFSDVKLATYQSEALSTIGPDEYLRGLKYVPFEESQVDEMAAYLANNLSCIFQEGYGGSEFSVFVNRAKIRQSFDDIVWVLEKRLNSCNEITLAKQREQADWFLDVEARSMNPAQGLWQVWVDVWEKEAGAGVKGLATYAYFLSEKRAEDISGTWWIYDLHSRAQSGRLEISEVPARGHRGDLFGSNGELKAQNIVMNLNEHNISWTHYDRRLNKTFDASGVIQSDGGMARIIISVQSFPGSGETIEQELLPYKRH